MNDSPMFRPPAEAYSLIVRVAQGCPWNRCGFCGMYKGVKYRALSNDEWLPDLKEQLRFNPNARRVFLADGDVMALPTDRLVHILTVLNEDLPRLSRVNVYANGASINDKTVDELKALRDLKLNTLYMGLESGSNAVLANAKKRETAEDMIKAANRAQAAGFRMSIMVLIGLAGRAGSEAHAVATAKALNAMQPRLLSALRVIPVDNTPLGKEFEQGSFDELTEREATEEMIILIENLELDGTIFRANHVSNILPLEGRFPKDKDKLLTQLGELLKSDFLDGDGPGSRPFSL